MLPCATPNSAPIPRLSIAAWSSTSHPRFNSLHEAWAASASLAGVSLLAGSFTRSRAKFWASPIVRPRSSAVCSDCSLPPLTLRAKVSTCFSFFLGSDLYLSASQLPIRAPSPAAATSRSASLPPSILRTTVRKPLALAVRVSAPATRRASTLENFALLPPPTTTTRFAATPSGRCRIDKSYSLPVNSPLRRSSASQPDCSDNAGSFTSVELTDSPTDPWLSSLSKQMKPSASASSVSIGVVTS